MVSIKVLQFNIYQYAAYGQKHFAKFISYTLRQYMLYYEIKNNNTTNSIIKNELVFKSF